VVDPRASTDFLVLEVQESTSHHQYVARIASDGSHFQRLTPVPTAGTDLGGLYPAWSPDRSRVALSRYSSSTGTYDLYVMNADGTDLRRVLDRDTHDVRPRWSPDGTRLVFVSMPRTATGTGEPHLHVVNLDGTGLRRVTTGADPEDQGSWSPDGTRILFRTLRDNAWSLQTVRADGTDQRPVRADAMPAADPAWSPDGRRIVFRGFPQAGGDGLYAVDVDGTNLVRLTAPGGARDFEPSWSPDGQSIAFGSTRGGGEYSRVYRMRADGTGITPVPVPATHIYAGRAAWR
jgi:Tol biopolymer transport system component